jgi:hypothetical protein
MSCPEGQPNREYETLLREGVFSTGSQGGEVRYGVTRQMQALNMTSYDAIISARSSYENNPCA